MTRIRPFQPGDEPALAEICVRTADAGADATGILADDRLWGDLFVLPYVARHPELAWVVHDPSGIALRVDPQLLAILRRAGAGSGPIEPPDAVRRFLDRLSGWEERRGEQAVPLAVLEHPRGGLLATGRVGRGEGLSYRGDDAR